MCYMQCLASNACTAPCCYCWLLLLFVALHFVLSQRTRNAIKHLGEFGIYCILDAISVAPHQINAWMRFVERRCKTEKKQHTHTHNSNVENKSKRIIVCCCMDQFKVEWRWASMVCTAQRRSNIFQKSPLSQAPPPDLTLTANFICTFHKASLHFDVHYIKPNAMGFVQNAKLCATAMHATFHVWIENDAQMKTRGEEEWRKA